MLVTVFDKDRIADYQTMVSTLRNAGIRAELYLGNPKHAVGQQLKYADKRNSPCAVIQGGDELNDPAGPQVIVKDLMLGAELAKLEKDRADHLQRQAEAQTKIPQAKLVEAVRAILARHGEVTSASARRPPQFCTFCMSRTFIFMPLLMMMSPGF